MYSGSPCFSSNKKTEHKLNLRTTNLSKHLSYFDSLEHEPLTQGAVHSNENTPASSTGP